MGSWRPRPTTDASRARGSGASTPPTADAWPAMPRRVSLVCGSSGSRSTALHLHRPGAADPASLSPVVILRTPTDIFPNINIPVIAVAWQYTGLNPEEMEGRITTGLRAGPHHHGGQYRAHRVDDRQRPGDHQGLPAAERAASIPPTPRSPRSRRPSLRQLPPGTQPPLIINYSASSVPILQLALSGEGLSEQQLNDLGLNFLRTQLVTVPGASIPYPYGGKQRQVMVDLNPRAAAGQGAVARPTCVNAVGQQNLVLPSGTAKIGAVRIRRATERQPADGGRAERPADQGGRQLDHLSARRRPRARRLRAADQHRAAGRPARRAGHRPEGRQRLHARRRATASATLLPRVAADAAARAEDPAARRPVDLRAGGGQRRDPRGGHRRLPHRA